jgi:type I restriction enzyme M protein
MAEVTREKERQTWLQKAIEEKEIIIEHERIRYTNSKGADERDYTQPEEKVRAFVFAELLYHYKYKAKNIYINLPVELQPDDKFADIAIFYPDDDNKVFAIIELKKETANKKEITKAIREQYSYAIIKDAQYFVFDCNIGTERKAWAIYGKDGNANEKWGHKERVQNLVHDLPIDYGKVKDWNYIRGNKEHALYPISNHELYEIFKKCHDILWEGGKKDPAEAFDEMSKIIFVKSMDEYKTGKNQPYKFQIGNHETNDKIGVATRIRKFFEEVKSDKEHVFMEDVEEADDGTTKRMPSTIKTKSERLYKIVSLLQSVDLKNTELDAKGRAFEQFLDTVFKSKLGQYFTHRNIVNFCVHMLEPQEHELILDPSCGSGGFLLYSLGFVREFLKSNYDLEEKEEYAEFIQRYKEYANKKLFGIEKNEKIARVAMMDMVIYEDGSTNIEDNDGLIDFSLFKNHKIRGGRGIFNIILSNPPFGAKVNYEELESFKDFSLGGEDRNQQASDILFVERNIDFLQPDYQNPKHKNKTGGRMAIVLPDGVLNNTSLWYVRKHIQEYAYVDAIVSLPDFAFKKTGSGSKTSLVFLKKFTVTERNNYLKVKQSFIDSKQQELANLQEQLNQQLLNFLQTHKIAERIGSIYEDIVNTWDNFESNLVPIKDKYSVFDKDGFRREKERNYFATENLTSEDVYILVKEAQDLYKRIGKTDLLYDENEEDPIINLYRYYEELKALSTALNKFFEPSFKIINRVKTKAANISKTKLEIKDDTQYKELCRLLQILYPKVNINDPDEIRAVYLESKEHSNEISERNPLWVSTSSQVNEKNLIFFLKSLALDILKDLRSDIRELEIKLEYINGYKPDFEAHKEVLRAWNYPVFMAIAEKIGYDSTGRLDQNQLYAETWIGEGSDAHKIIFPQDERTILFHWRSFKQNGNMNYRSDNIFVRNSGDLNISMTVEPFRLTYLKAETSISEIPTVPLREIIFDISGGATPKAKGDSYLEEDDPNAIPFLRIQNIGVNELIIEGLNYINSDTHYNYLRRSILQPFDVLVTITGRVGTSCVIGAGFKGNINQHIVRFSVLPSYLPEYLSIFLNTGLGKLLTNRFVTGGTRVALDYETLLNVRIPRVSLDKQREVVEYHNKMRLEVAELSRRINELKQITSNELEKQLL